MAAWCASTPERPELQTDEISILSTLTERRREITDEELELIEMRYQQALALMNLEVPFAAVQLDIAKVSSPLLTTQPVAT